MRSFLALLLLVLVAHGSAFRHPGVSSVVGSPDEKIETNRRKLSDAKAAGSEKLKEVSTKAVKKVKDVKDEVKGEVNHNHTLLGGELSPPRGSCSVSYTHLTLPTILLV